LPFPFRTGQRGRRQSSLAIAGLFLWRGPLRTGAGRSALAGRAPGFD